MAQNKSYNAQGNGRYKQKTPFQMPLVEICGRKRVLIENHQGITGYDSGEIIVKVCSGSVYVQGSELNVLKICKEKLVITGMIDGIRFQGRE